jgi:hypothetical protein
VRTLTLLLLPLTVFLSAHAEESTPLQKQLIGHWVADKDSHLHTYFSNKRRIVENSVQDSDAALSLREYVVWDEWPELRTIVLSIDEGMHEGNHEPLLLVITLSEDGKSANVREKTGATWGKVYRVRREDDRTYPRSLPVKLKILDMEHGLGAQP